jgi:hypothetical protein
VTSGSGLDALEKRNISYFCQKMSLAPDQLYSCQKYIIMYIISRMIHLMYVQGKKVNMILNNTAQFDKIL